LRASAIAATSCADWTSALADGNGCKLEAAVSGAGHGGADGASGPKGHAVAKESPMPFPSFPFASDALLLPFRLRGLLVLGLDAECGLWFDHD